MSFALTDYTGVCRVCGRENTRRTEFLSTGTTVDPNGRERLTIPCGPDTLAPTEPHSRIETRAAFLRGCSRRDVVALNRGFGTPADREAVLALMFPAQEAH